MGNNHSTMNVHICGLNINDKDIYESENKIIDQIFLFKKEKESTKDYIIKYSKDPYWNAYIYSKKNTNNYQLISKVIANQINKCNGEENNNQLSKQEKDELKNHIIVHFINDNNSDILLCEEFSKDETRFKLSDNFPLILFISRGIERNNLYYKEQFFDYTYINCINLSSINFT